MKLPISRSALAAIATLILAPLALTACGSDDSGGNGDETVKVGFVLPLTGPSSVSGNDGKEGAELAVKYANEQGLLDAGELELLIEDDKGLPESGVVAAQKLLTEGVQIIGGTMNSSVALAIANMIGNRDDVLYLITGASTQQPLDEQVSGNIFGISHSNPQYGAFYHKYIRDVIKPQSIAFVYENSDFGLAELASVEKGLESEGVDIAMKESFERTETDYSSLISQVASSGADAVYLGVASPSIPAAFFTQMEQNGVSMTKLMNAGNMVQQLIDLGGSSVEGLISADVYLPSIETDENQKFTELFQAEYGKTPTAIHALAWESVMLTIEAMNEAGTTNEIPKIAETLKASSYPMLRGNLDFDDTGRAQGPGLIVGVENGQFTIIDTIAS